MHATKSSARPNGRTIPGTAPIGAVLIAVRR
jgi:hypothetical protein